MLYRMIAYTDGSSVNVDSRLNHYVGGYGLHFYVCVKSDLEIKKQIPGLPTWEGYVSATVKKLDDEFVDILLESDCYGVVKGRTTNNIGEMSAVIEACKEAKIMKDNLRKETPTADLELVIYLDSTYVLEGFTKFIPIWISNNWKTSDGQPVKNQTFWHSLIKVVNELKTLGINVVFRKVKAHSGDFGNDKADALAKMASSMAVSDYMSNKVNVDRTSRTITYVADKEKKVKYDISRLLCKNNFIFTNGIEDKYTTEISDQPRYIVHQGNYTLLGKTESDSSFCVAFLKETPIPLAQIKTLTSTILSGDTNVSIFEGNLNSMRQVKYHPLIDESSKLESVDELRNVMAIVHRGDSISELTLTVSAPDGNKLFQRFVPADLAYRGLSQLINLGTLLKDFLEIKLNKKEVRQESDFQLSKLLYTDITDLLYEEPGKKNIRPLKSSIKQTLRFIDMELPLLCSKDGEVKVNTRLLLDRDLPNRNTLAALKNPEVYVVTNPLSDPTGYFSFFVIVKCDDGEAIFTSLYSNIRMYTKVTTKVRGVEYKTRETSIYQLLDIHQKNDIIKNAVECAISRMKELIFGEKKALKKQNKANKASREEEAK